MSDHRLTEIERLFQAALALPEGERQAYLDAECPRSDLKAQVWELLRYDRVEKGGLTDPKVELEEDLMEEAGTTIGPYKLLQKIGEGGMGVVYMAEQQGPVRRRVALKIIKLGMDTRQVVARFEAERQALAMMDHPNIARVLDAGATDSGRPFFVMDLVQGVPITDFCEKNQLEKKDRLHLFVQVCQAIQSAHHKGVIHRDIKPSNVLVTLQHSEPTPIVIDFGIAKAINQSLTEKTYFTQFGAMIGTPAYMSPEQAEMSSIDVDTRTDVYSLGALLYEMLTGTTPFPDKRLRSVGYAEMCRIIAEETPPKPSTRSRELSRQSDHRAQTPIVIPEREFRIETDLDWISMKCLEKDRRRRYDTPNELVADIRRFLNNEPVTAAAPTLGYQLQKTYERNKLAVRFLLLLFVVLMASLTAVTWQWREAVAQRAEKEVQRLVAVEEQNKARLAERDAKKEEGKARSALYSSYLARAHLELQRNKIGIAREVLDRCSPDLRGWEWEALQSWTHGEIATLGSHTAAVFDVEYSPDGRWIASCGGGNPSWRSQSNESGPGEVILWDARDGRRLHTLRGHSHVIHAVAFSHDNATLASAGQDGTVRLWDVASGQEKPVSPLTLTEGATAVTFSDDGKYLAAGSFDGTCHIWNADTFESVRQLQETKAPVFGLGFTPEARSLVASAHDGIVHRPRLTYWDLNLDQVKFVKDPEAVFGAAFALSRDGSVVLTPEVQRFHVRSAHDGTIQAYSGWHDGIVRGLAINMNRRRIASCGDDGAIRVWDIGRWDKEAFRLFGHAGKVNTVAFNPTGDQLVSGGADGEVKIWSLNRAAPELADVPMSWLFWGYRFTAAAFTPDSQDLTLMHSVGHTIDIDIETHAAGNYRKFPLTYVPRADRNIAEFSRDGAWVVGCLKKHPNIVTCWNRETGKERIVLEGHELKIDHVSVNVGATRIAVASRSNREGEVTVWDGSTGEVLLRRRQTGSFPTRIAISSTGDRLAVASIEIDDRRPKFESIEASSHSHIRVYDVETGQEVLHIGDVQDVWQALRFSPSGDRLAAAGANQKSVLVWNFERQKQVVTDHGVVGAAEMAFSPDGERFAVGSCELTKVINAHTGEDVLLLRTSWQLAPSGDAFQPCLCWSPDGRSLAVTSLDRRLSIWSIPASNPRSLAIRLQTSHQRDITYGLRSAYQHHAFLNNEAAADLLTPVKDATLSTAVEYWMRSRLFVQLGKKTLATADLQRAVDLGLNRELHDKKEDLRPYYQHQEKLVFEAEVEAP